MAKFVEPKVHFQDLNTLWVESKPLRAVLYFVTLFASLAIVLRKLPRANTVSQRLLVFPALAAFALCSTWKHIVIFLIEDARAHSNMTTFDWVQSSEFFVKAYRGVTDTPQGYWWSEQLLMFALPYTAFLNFKALEINMLTLELCAYTWLGFGGAISGALPLFLYRYHARLRKSQQQFPTWALNCMVVCLTVGFWCVLGLKAPADTSFKKSLLLIHVVLFIPSLFPSERCQDELEARGRSKYRVIFYSLLALVIMANHFYQSFVTIPDVARKSASNLLMAGFLHPGQTEISLDLLLCFVVCVFYVVYQEESSLDVPVLVPFVVLTPVLSLGATLSLLMVYEELFVCAVNVEEVDDKTD